MAEHSKRTSMETQQSQAADDNTPLATLEESLLSLEKLDRTSPELWPQQIPGVSDYGSLENGSQPPCWDKTMTQDDLTYIQHLKTLSVSTLIMEVKKLHDSAYQLGLEEAKEMTRGKYLNIFSSRRQK